VKRIEHCAGKAAAFLASENLPSEKFCQAKNTGPSAPQVFLVEVCGASIRAKQIHRQLTTSTWRVWR
jgi:hypothetical protein